MKTEILSVQSFDELFVAEIKTDKLNTMEYISGEKALKQNFIELKEVDEGGRVNDITLTNKSDFYVFFLDGDVLIGAKQNRVLNSSVFIKPKSVYNIPVSCVEAGRWQYSRTNFESAPFTVPSSMRSAKSKKVAENLSFKQKHYADQGEV